MAVSFGVRGSFTYMSKRTGNHLSPGREDVEEHAARPSDLGARVTYLATTPRDETRGPDCECAVPYD
jgi:hypothetical protein